MGLEDEIGDLKRKLAEAEARLREKAAVDADLLDSGTRHRLLIESLAQALWETDAAGVVVADSPSWRAYTGQTLEELLGYGWLDAIHPDDRAYAERQWREAVAVLGLLNAEFRLRAPDGGWRWTNVRAAPLLDGDGRVEKWLGMNIDIDDRKRAEAELRESEERQAYFLALSDALRPLSDQEEIQAEAMRLLGEKIGVNRAQYYIADETGAYLSSSGGYSNGIAAAIGTFHLIEFGQYAFDGFHAGETQVVSDATTDPRINDDVLRSYEAVGFLAYIGVPFVQRGRLVGTLAVHQSEPRQWTASERMMVEETAERAGIAVEQARAEAALRESHARQAFLVKLSDALRAEPDADAVAAMAVRMTAAELRPDRCYIVSRRQDGNLWDVGPEVRTPGLPAMPPVLDQDEFPEALRQISDRTMVIDDTAARTDFTETEKQSLLALGFGGLLMPTLRRGEGSPLWSMVAASTSPRQWTSSEIQLVEEVGERTWAAVERARAEAALRESEARLAAAFESVPAGIAVFGPDGKVVLGNEEYRRFLPTGIIPSRDPKRAHRWQAWDAEGRPIASQDWPSARTLRGEAVIPGLDMLYTDDDGQAVWTNVATAPVTDGSGQVISCVSVISDITERKRAEAALTESEERFRQFANASSAGMWIRDAATLDLEYASPAMEAIYGVPLADLARDPKIFTGLILPEDRDDALARLAQVQGGQPVADVFRIQRPSDRSFRWIQSTSFPLFDEQGAVERVAGISLDVTDARLAIEHQGVLLAELQHRVRNIMAIIRSIAARSGQRADSVEAYAELLAGRLLALSRVQALLTRAANVSVSLRTIVLDEVSVQAHHEGQYEIDGPDVDISPKAAEVLTLAVHELSTNALKYGALSAPHGKVTVRWTVDDRSGTPWLSLDWRDEGAPEPASPGPDQPRRKGFGSELIEGRIPYELGGRGTLVIAPGGAHCHLEFPLRSGPSVLETGAPQRATVFGGALDMTGEPDLGGRRVLVVEDDYYLATDAARALAGAGAEVAGPCATEAEARAEIQARRPDAVLLDINLGPGPTFKLAETLKDQGVPFVFVTGYDQEVIPPEFAGVGRLEKPVQLRQMVGAVAELLAPAP